MLLRFKQACFQGSRYYQVGETIEINNNLAVQRLTQAGVAEIVVERPAAIPNRPAGERSVAPPAREKAIAK